MMSIRTAPLVIRSAASRSRRSEDVATIFGLGADDGGASDGTIPAVAVPVPPAGGIIFITGPSGGGKSLLLRSLARVLRRRRRIVIDAAAAPVESSRPVVDLLPRLLPEALGMLGRAGLAEAPLFVKPPSRLSEGQRHRFALAWSMAQADRLTAKADPQRSAFILADEFLAPLDRTTARNIAMTLRGAIDRSRHTLIAATAHDDLLEPLKPDVLVHVPLCGDTEVLTPCAS